MMDQPYRPPAAELTQVDDGARRRPFRDATMLTRTVMGLLIAGSTISAAAIVVYLVQNAVLGEVVAGLRDYDDTPFPLLIAMVGTGLLQLLVTLTSYVVIGMWLYRMCWNAHSLAGAWQMTVTPRWSVLWYFIPFANLWMPFVAMRETWKASAAPDNVANARSHPIIPLWWALWLVTGVLSWAAMRAGLTSNDAQDEIDGNVAMIASDAGNIVLSLCLLFVVRRLWRLQQEAHAHRGAQGA